MIRIIKRDEHIIVCKNCKCVLGFSIYDVDGEEIVCPECKNIIDLSKHEIFNIKENQ